jgi:hypothetical protein
MPTVNSPDSAVWNLGYHLRFADERLLQNVRDQPPFALFAGLIFPTHICCEFRVRTLCRIDFPGHIWRESAVRSAHRTDFPATPLAVNPIFGIFLGLLRIRRSKRLLD